MKVLTFSAHGKNEQADLKPDEAKAVSAFAKAIRKQIDLTQDEMATVPGTSPSGYKEW